MGIIDKYFNGYIQIEAKEGCFAKLSNYLLSNNIPAETKDNTVWVSSSSFKRIEGIILRKYCKAVSRVKGLQGIKEKIRCKSAVASALVFSLVLSLFLSSTVWDIRIQGNESVTDSSIIENLSKVGLEIGSLWYTLDRSDIENKLLSHYPEISWININRRGMVAYVVVGENENRPDEPKKKNEYSNIIATRDAVIEEITVHSGTAEVKVGDTVRCGDVLISGCTGGDTPILCRAEGTIIGRVSESIEETVNSGYKKIVEKNKKLCSRTINFLNFSLNIFKSSRNLPSDCVIIEERNTYSLPNNRLLPFFVTSEYSVVYSFEEAFYSDIEIVKIASRRLDSRIAELLLGSDLVRISTKGGFIENGYRIQADLSYLTGIGQELPLFTK